VQRDIPTDVAVQVDWQIVSVVNKKVECGKRRARIRVPVEKYPTLSQFAVKNGTYRQALSDPSYSASQNETSVKLMIENTLNVLFIASKSR
jgi:hypothetical protein